MNLKELLIMLRQKVLDIIIIFCMSLRDSEDFGKNSPKFDKRSYIIIFTILPCRVVSPSKT